MTSRPTNHSTLNAASVSTQHNVSVEPPKSCQSMSLADLNLTNSMTSLLQHGSCPILRPLPTSTPSIECVSMKQSTSFQQRHKRRQKKVTPRLQSDHEFLKRAVTFDLSEVTPSSESTINVSSRSEEVLVKSKRKECSTPQSFGSSAHRDRQTSISSQSARQCVHSKDVAVSSHLRCQPDEERHQPNPKIDIRHAISSNRRKHVVYVPSNDHNYVINTLLNASVERTHRIGHHDANTAPCFNDERYSSDVIVNRIATSSCDEGYQTRDSLTSLEQIITSQLSLHSHEEIYL